MKRLVTPIIFAAALITASPVFAAEPTTVTVKAGDSLNQIAIKENITLTKLLQLNPQIKNPNLIYPGDVIKTQTQSYSADDLYVMSHIISAEAQGEPYAGKIAVGEVIMNRTVTGFGNTIREVVFSPGQFTPISNGLFYATPTAESIQAAKEVLSNHTPDPNGIMFYMNPTETTNAFMHSLKVVETIGHQVYCVKAN